jgi:hypothetical protein
MITAYFVPGTQILCVCSVFYLIISPVITLLAILTWLLWLILALSGALPPGYLDIEIGGWGM